MHRKFGLLSLGKPSSHSTALYPAFLLFVCSVFTFLYIGCEAYSVKTDGYGIFVVRTKGRGQTQTSLHKRWLGRTQKPFLSLPRQGIEFSFFRCEFRLSNHWATSPVKWFLKSVYTLWVNITEQYSHPYLVRCHSKIGLEWWACSISNNFYTFCYLCLFYISPEIIVMVSWT